MCPISFAAQQSSDPKATNGLGCSYDRICEKRSRIFPCQDLQCKNMLHRRNPWEDIWKNEIRLTAKRCKLTTSELQPLCIFHNAVKVHALTKRYNKFWHFEQRHFVGNFPRNAWYDMMRMIESVLDRESCRQFFSWMPLESGHTEFD